MKDKAYPLHSLIEGNWFKLICGASYQHLPAVRSLALAYSIAGADCIDVAADPAVIAAAQAGMAVASKLNGSKPWLMVSLNDGEDPHFRKAEFDATQCPTDCSRPCEAICPANAITKRGISDHLCYGCGRCLPICPYDLITTRSYVSTPSTIITLIEDMAIDAVEIHTQVGHLRDFQRLWRAIATIIPRLKLLAISCPDAPEIISYFQSLYNLINPLPCPLIWQTDGRPMSGDIGKGTTHAAIKFAEKILQTDLPGYVQLAGGTNGYTVNKLKSARMLQNTTSSRGVSGVAYGSYARSLLSPILDKLETTNHVSEIPLPNPQSLTNPVVQQLENNPNLLKQAVNTAYDLVNQIKSTEKY
ncbi:MAG: LdpA C-terminal domain-containing domain [Xenococcaceae cyanobacterium MO_167.B27]|nr:LdpA C-terminal domain-containing domain [Xenococcaceae cyanobacterium MO_167.B27]